MTMLRTLLVMGLLASTSHAAEIELDRPMGGWRLHDGSAGFRQEVNYPASSVNAVGHGEAALIRGRIAGAAKSRAPHRLVVNGAAMPLLTEDGGAFARPYSFGPGSNSVEIRSPDGSTRKRVQFYEARSNRPQSRLRVVLSWDSDATDLDLHVLTPDGGHAFFGNRVLQNGGVLDVDVTTGYGPEIFAMPAPMRGAYHVYVNYYGAGYDQGGVTIAQVAIITNENTPQEKQQVVRVPMRKPGELTLIKSFYY